MWTRKQYRRIAAVVLPVAAIWLAGLAYTDPEPSLAAHIAVAIPWAALVAVLLCWVQSQVFLAGDDDRPSPKVQEVCYILSVLVAGLSYQALVEPLLLAG